MNFRKFVCIAAVAVVAVQFGLSSLADAALVLTIDKSLKTFTFSGSAGAGTTSFVISPQFGSLQFGSNGATSNFVTGNPFNFSVGGLASGQLNFQTSGSAFRSVNIPIANPNPFGTPGQLSANFSGNGVANSYAGNAALESQFGALAAVTNQTLNLNTTTGSGFGGSMTVNVITAVPEPSSMALLGIALSGAGLRFWRMRNRSVQA